MEHEIQELHFSAWAWYDSTQTLSDLAFDKFGVPCRPEFVERYGKVDVGHVGKSRSLDVDQKDSSGLLAVPAMANLAIALVLEQRSYYSRDEFCASSLHLVLRS